MKNSSRAVHFGLALLALGQVLWWGYLIVTQQGLIAMLKGTPEAAAQLESYKMMVLAEGAFFFLVISFGIWLAQKMSRHELQVHRSQKDFMSAITHELKTPLANVRLCLDTLERPNLSDEQKNMYLLRAQNAIDSLLNEIDTILHLANQPTQEPLLEIELNQVTKSCTEAASQQIQAKIEIESREPIKLLAPEREVKIVLQNLIDNAVKYSQRDGQLAQVKIQNQIHNGQIMTIIQDNGIGMSREDIKKAFDPFFRSETSKSLVPTGTGLGLALVKKIADRSQIKVNFKSDGNNQGTLAQVIWPRHWRSDVR